MVGRVDGTWTLQTRYRSIILSRAFAQTNSVKRDRKSNRMKRRARRLRPIHAAFRPRRTRCHGASARAHESDAARRPFDRTLRVLLWIPGCRRTTIGPWQDVLSLHLRHVARLGTEAHDLVVQWRAGCPQYVRALPGVRTLSALRRVVCHRGFQEDWSAHASAESVHMGERHVAVRDRFTRTHGRLVLHRGQRHGGFHWWAER